MTGSVMSCAISTISARNGWTIRWVSSVQLSSRRKGWVISCDVAAKEEAIYVMGWVLFALLAALFFGSRQVITKKVLMYEHASEYLSVTCMMAFLFSLFFLPRMDFALPPTVLFLMYLKGGVLTLGWLLAAKAFRHLEISMVTPLTNLTPVFLLVWGVLFLGEFPSLLQYGGVALLIFGAYWLQADHHLSSLVRPWLAFKNRYSILMLVAIFLYSICAMIDKIVLKVANPYTYLCVSYGVLAFHYLIIQFIKYDGLKDIKHAFMKGKYLIFVAALLLIFADVFYYVAVAIPGAMVSLIIPLKRMSTLVATLVGGRLFHDHNMMQRFIACIIMICGVVLVVIG